MDRVLCAGVLWHGVREGMSVIDVNDGVEVTPFERECHSTVFYPGFIAILDASRFDEFVADDIEMMIKADGTIPDKKKLNDYFQSSSLYYDAATSGQSPLLLHLTHPLHLLSRVL